MKVKAVKLGELLEVQNGFAFKKEFFSDAEGKPLIRIRDIDKGSTEAFYAGEYREEFLVHEGDYLIGMDGAFTCRKWTGPEALLNQRVCRLRNFSARVLPEYVFFGIQPALTAIEGKTSFVTVKHISGKQILDIELPLPDIQEQQRIVDILSRAEGIVRLRNEAQQKAAELVPAIFLEMFGNPVLNPKGWPIVPLGQVSDVQGGLQVTTKRASLPLEAPYLRVANVYRSRLDLREIKSIRLTVAELQRTRLEVGDLLFVEGHGNPQEVGRCAVWDGSINGCTHQNHLIRARPDETKLLPEFACASLNSVGGRRTLVDTGKTTSGLSTISAQNVKQAKLMLPPLSLQELFKQRANDAGSIAAQQVAATEKAQSVFASLLAQSFN